MKKNVILLGGSNSIMQNGLQKGLRDAIETGGGGVDFYNFALGGSNCTQNLYELNRDRNKELIENADLIITESNTNDGWIRDDVYNYKAILAFYKHLSSLKSKILVLILPFFVDNHKTTNQLHRKLAKEFSFNIIDMSSLYERENLRDFFSIDNGYHHSNTIYKELGENIIKNISAFKTNSSIKHQDENYAICKAEELEGLKDKNEIFLRKNSAFNEKCIRLFQNQSFKIPKKYSVYKIIGAHVWTIENSSMGYVSKKWLERKEFANYIEIKNKKDSFLQYSTLDNCFYHVRSNLILDEQSFLSIRGFKEGKHNLLYCDLISIFLSKTEDVKVQIDFESLKNEDIYIDKELDFSHLIPRVKFYKELIDEYCLHTDPIKEKEFQDKINGLNSQVSNLNLNVSNLQNENSSLKQILSSQEHKAKTLKLSFLEEKVKRKVLKNKLLEKDLGFTHEDILQSKILNQKVKDLENLLSNIQSPQANIYTSAKLRVQNHLACKLGQALILNSKSLKGYIRMPYVLSYIKDKHKAEQKAYNEKILKNPSLKLPSLDSYPDYEAALKEKECLTYRLGEALMKANKEWYKGGYIKFYFESKRLRKEFKKRKLAR